MWNQQGALSFPFFSSLPSQSGFPLSHYFCPNLLPSTLSDALQATANRLNPSLSPDGPVIVGKSLTFVSSSFLTYKLRIETSHRSVVKTKWNNVCDYAVCSIKCYANASHFLISPMRNILH